MTEYYNDIYINDKYTFLGSKKYNPIILDNVDKIIDDYYLKEKTVELAEIKSQYLTINRLVSKYNVDLLIGGDLQNQILASNYSFSKFKIPSLGIYSACASFVEGLIIGSNILKNKNINIIVTTSSHNLVSEKQFRFPIEYGSIRKNCNTCTCTGSVSALISNKKSNVRIESSTIGKVIKTNHKDSNDMGSAMAPACAETLYQHLKDTNREVEYYDLILTGDLGIYGLEIMKKYYEKKYDKKINNILDSGSIFYKEKNIFAGASGPTCLPLVLFDYILKQKKYKKILLVATGSLHSVTSCNLNLPIPSIAHIISLEVKN